MIRTNVLITAERFAKTLRGAADEGLVKAATVYDLSVQLMDAAASYEMEADEAKDRGDEVLDRTYRAKSSLLGAFSDALDDAFPETEPVAKEKENGKN